MRNVRPDALVFDLDGTLWDAAAASAEGWNHALEELGMPARVSVDEIRSVSGTPFEGCVAILLSKLGPPSDRLLRSLEAHERAVLEETGGALYPGVAEGLRLLAEVHPLYVVSNCPDWYLKAFLRSSGLRDRFTGWDCHGASGLPKAVMLQNLMRRCVLQAAVYLGDTQGDQEAAAAAGMTFVHARYGFGDLGEDCDPTVRGHTGGSQVPAVYSFTEFAGLFLADTE